MRALPFSGMGQAHSLKLLPVIEGMPSAGDDAPVDRVCALPAVGSMAERWMNDSDLQEWGWEWLTLGAVAGTCVYAIAAMALARVCTYYPSVPQRVLATLFAARSGCRSGARELREVKHTPGEKRRREPTPASPDVWPVVLHPPANWLEAKSRMAAANHVLREALLAVPDSDADAAYLRSFADVVRPVNEEVVDLRP